MDLYTTIASWTGWPAIVALMLFAGGFAYWVLNNRIELLKDKNQWQETQLKNLKENSPDILAQKLSDRLRVATEELKRLHKDQKTSEGLVRRKQIELVGIKTEIEELRIELNEAQELLSSRNLVCPYCKAPLEIHDYPSEVVEYEERDFDIDHEYTRYECGYELYDGEEVQKCNRTNRELS